LATPLGLALAGDRVGGGWLRAAGRRADDRFGRASPGSGKLIRSRPAGPGRAWRCGAPVTRNIE
jgi:hypothetical protein